MKTNLRKPKWQNIIFYSITILFIFIGISLFLNKGSLKADSPTEDLYEKISNLAKSGDPIAVKMLIKLDNFLQKQGMTLSEAKGFGLNDSYTIENLQVRAEGIRPFYVKIYNDPVFSDSKSLNEYVKKRKDSLSDFVKQNPERLIEVAVSPSGRITLPKLWKIKEDYGLDADELSLDVFLQGKWDSMIWVKDREEDNNYSSLSIDLSKNQGEVDGQIRNILSSMPSPPGQDTSSKEVNLQNTEFGIRYARGKMLARNALLLQKNPSIMLADPITDLKDAFAGQAIDVEVVRMPHVFVEKNFIQGKIYPTNNLKVFHGAPTIPNELNEKNSVPEIPTVSALRDIRSSQQNIGTYAYSATGDGWKANDSGNDDPDNKWMIYAPNSITHDSLWYDYDNAQYCDWVLDWQMDWWEGAPDWFRKNSNYYKLTHEIRANKSVYEADSYISTDLPSVTHNEDSDWFEEQYDGYEEKEVGMDRPWEINPAYRYRLWTAWCPLNNGNSFFEIESELTKHSPFSGDPWYPAHWDQLGAMTANGAQ